MKAIFPFIARVDINTMWEQAKVESRIVTEFKTCHCTNNDLILKGVDSCKENDTDKRIINRKELDCRLLKNNCNH